jgi:dephospho-CoA kinase
MTAVIGITGGIGSGKSVVTDELLRLGYTVLDTDVISREVVLPGSATLTELISIFGPNVISSDGALDRSAISDIIFVSPEKMDCFNRVMKRAIEARIDGGISEYRAGASETGKPLFLSSALLYEAGWDRKCDEVWFVMANDRARARRAATRDGVSEEKIRERMAFQMPEAKKRERADVIIDNNGTSKELLDKLDGLLAATLSG